MNTKKITLNELKTLIKELLIENEQQDISNAEKYVNLMINKYGDNYKTLHSAILYNLVNSKYNRVSNDFVLKVWQALDKKFNPEPALNEYGEDSGGQDMTWGMYNRDNYVAPSISTNPYAVAKEIKDELPDIFDENMVEKKVQEYFLEHDLNQKKLQTDDFWEDLYYALTEDFGKKYANPSQIEEDYPGDSQYDSNAPWNQISADYDGFDIVEDADNRDNFGVRLRDSAGSTSNVIYLTKILEEVDASPEDYQYFDWVLEQNPKPASFMKKLGMLMDKYADYAEYSNEPDLDEEMKYNPKDYQ